MASAPAPTAARTVPRDPAPGTAHALELAVVMDRAIGSRLIAAERLVLSLPALVGDGLDGVELFLSSAGSLTAVARVVGEARPERLRRRLAFWGARAGARSIALDQLAEEQRAAHHASLARCPRRAAIGTDAIDTEARAFFDEAGAPPDRPGRAGPLPVLALEVGGPGWEASRWDGSAQALFVASPLAPAQGDELVLRLLVPGAEAHCARARVGEVREVARPGAPTGFTLALGEATPEMLRALSAHVPPEQAIEEQLRAAPRYTVHAPAAVVQEGPGAAEEVEELGEELGRDAPAGFVADDISQGGAFIRASRTWPVGSRLRVAIALPTGDLLRAQAEVAVVDRRGMGLRWVVDAASGAEVAEAVARVAAKKPRALVVDDDALARQMLGDALGQRGFEVLTAQDGGSGLAVLAEEILSLDLLIADLWMPNMDGKALLRTVRGAGGESDLAIVLVSGNIETGMEAVLEREGADAVLSKALGPQVIAQAAAAVLERKRQGAAG